MTFRHFMGGHVLDYLLARGSCQATSSSLAACSVTVFAVGFCILRMCNTTKLHVCKSNKQAVSSVVLEQQEWLRIIHEQPRWMSVGDPKLLDMLCCHV